MPVCIIHVHVSCGWLPEAGGIGECGSYDTETVAIEHDTSQLDYQSKHHLPSIVSTDVSVTDRGQCSRCPVQGEYVIVDGRG